MHTTSRARRGRSSVSIAEYAFANRPLQMTFKASVDKKYYIYKSSYFSKYWSSQATIAPR